MSEQFTSLEESRLGSLSDWQVQTPGWQVQVPDWHEDTYYCIYILLYGTWEVDADTVDVDDHE